MYLYCVLCLFCLCLSMCNTNQNDWDKVCNMLSSPERHYYISSVILVPIWPVARVFCFSLVHVAQHYNENVQYMREMRRSQEMWWRSTVSFVFLFFLNDVLNDFSGDCCRIQFICRNHSFRWMSDVYSLYDSVNVKRFVQLFGIRVCDIFRRWFFYCQFAQIDQY